MFQMSNSYPHSNTTVYNPQLPYYATIPTMSSGTLIIVYGRVPYGSKRFDFNFMAGSVISEHTKTCGDIAFHFNPRFDSQLVVRNTRKDNKWGSEERDPKAIPFEPGKQFEAMLLVEDSGYKIAVNGKHFIDYYHRIPLSCVGIFNIDGDVVIDRVEYRRECRYLPPTYGAQPAISPMLAPVMNPSLPYHHIFNGGLREGLMIYISGRPNASSDRFTFDFCCGAHPFSDIALHFDVRYRQSLVVRNTSQNKNWGPEERSITYFPFKAGVNFDMIFRIESNRFMVAVNGQHFVQYMHRVPITSVDALRISGDVIIASIRFAQS